MKKDSPVGGGVKLKVVCDHVATQLRVKRGWFGRLRWQEQCIRCGRGVGPVYKDNPKPPEATYSPPWEYPQRKTKRTREYESHLRSLYWRKRVVPAVLQRDGFTCRACGQAGGVLEVDHIAYRDQEGNSILGREMKYLHLLQTLCQSCHRAKSRKFA